VVESVDIYPTLCDLVGLPIPAGLSGSSLRPQLLDASTGGDAAIAYTPDAETIRTSRHRLIRHAPQDGTDAPAYELYDHESEAGETTNLAAARPELVAELDALLRRRLAQ
jgi:iduronate 2-sulfatase